MRIYEPVGTSYYIAPEAIITQYNEKCDLWSIGIVCFMLLSGKPPFDGKTDKDIIRKVRKGVVDFDIEELKEVSEDAKDFLKKMLTIHVERRCTGDEAMTHMWINKFNKATEDDNALADAFANLNKFNTKQKLQEAVINFVVYELASKEDMAELQKAFKVLDEDNDGELSKEELTRGYKKIYGDKAEEYVDQIFAKVDIDGSGTIDYSEWVVATINKANLLTDDKL